MVHLRKKTKHSKLSIAQGKAQLNLNQEHAVLSQAEGTKLHQLPSQAKKYRILEQTQTSEATKTSRGAWQPIRNLSCTKKEGGPNPNRNGAEAMNYLDGLNLESTAKPNDAPKAGSENPRGRTLQEHRSLVCSQCRAGESTKPAASRRRREDSETARSFSTDVWRERSRSRRRGGVEILDGKSGGSCCSYSVISPFEATLLIK